jgi:predicted enzyme related to lactoylglutathione lyase
VRTPDGDPPERQPDIDDWLWQELWTTEDSTALLFYQDLAGYDYETLEIPSGAYHVLKYQGRAYAGLAQLPWDSVPPVWLPYVRVEDPQAIADRVEELGGRVILSPDQIHSREAAVIEDPTGGALAVQRWVPQDQAGGE